MFFWNSLAFLMKVKEESKNVGLKLNIEKTKIMASGPITSWQIDGETIEAVTDFIFLGSKMTLAPWKKTYDQPRQHTKSRDFDSPTKIRLVKSVVFPIVMYRYESWTIKKAERRRIDAFELCCWRRLLRVRWTARRSNQSILKEISPEHSLEGLMFKLKLQYFGQLI